MQGMKPFARQLQCTPLKDEEMLALALLYGEHA